jgi:hypothetical protein
VKENTSSLPLKADAYRRPVVDADVNSRVPSGEIHDAEGVV